MHTQKWARGLRTRGQRGGRQKGQAEPRPRERPFQLMSALLLFVGIVLPPVILDHMCQLDDVLALLVFLARLESVFLQVKGHD